MELLAVGASFDIWCIANNISEPESAWVLQDFNDKSYLLSHELYSLLKYPKGACVVIRNTPVSLFLI